jgi:hypothetical protein
MERYKFEARDSKFETNVNDPNPKLETKQIERVSASTLVSDFDI